MAVKLGVLAQNDFQGALKKLMQSELPIRTAFKLKGLLNRVNEELKKHAELQQAIVDKYADRGEDGNVIVSPEGAVKFSGENLTKAEPELQELFNLEVELDTISAAELEKVSLSVRDLLLLDGVVN